MSMDFSLEFNGNYIHIIHPPDYAHNRGTRIEFFKDKRKALEWLGIKDAEPKP